MDREIVCLISRQIAVGSCSITDDTVDTVVIALYTTFCGDPRASEDKLILLKHSIKVWGYVSCLVDRLTVYLFD